MTVTADVVPENTIHVLDHGFVRLDGQTLGSTDGFTHCH